MKYLLSANTWDDAELQAIYDVCKSGRYTMGAKVREFELEFARFFGSKYAVMVNSGSSANLLAVAAQFYRQKNPLRPGDEVIVPAVSWSTTYYPLFQYGLRLRFVDIDIDSLNLDLDQVEAAITPQTRAIFAVNLLGAPNDFTRLRDICRRHGLLLLEDNCESMGAKFDGVFAGTFGVCGTFSTFFSHHICTMEGGVVVTDDEEIYHILVSLRAHGWTRELPDQNHVFNKSLDSFTDLYRFVLPGYNLRPLEMSGAVGLQQLQKLDGFLQTRRRNAEHLRAKLAHVEGIRLQKQIGEGSWFAFSFVLEGRLKGRRPEVIQELTRVGVETRPIVAGNFAKNPVLRYFQYSIHGDLPHANAIDSDGFYIGNHHVDLRLQIDEAASVLLNCTQQPVASGCK